MSGEPYAGADTLPADPWNEEQFDLVIQDDEWLDRFAARLDRAVEHAVGTSGLSVIESARGVIAALRRRRSGEADDFGEPVERSTVRFTNEKGTPIRAGFEQSSKDPMLVRLWMESPTSRVENTMTHAEALAIWTLLQRRYKVGPAMSAAELDASHDLPEKMDVRDWIIAGKFGLCRFDAKGIGICEEASL